MKKGRKLLGTLRCFAPPVSKPSSKSIRIGKKSKGNQLNDFPLLAALSNPAFNAELLEDLDVDEEYFLRNI